MDALTIDRARATLRLPESHSGSRPALEAMHERVVGEALEAAWDQPGDELLCVRALAIELRVDVRELGSRELEAAATRRWTAALVAELRRIVSEGDPHQLVRYASPSAALVDMGRSLAREDLRRAWAWAQLGFLEARGRATDGSITLADARASFVEVLARRPELCVGVLAKLAREPGIFIRLARVIPAPAWIELCAAALRVHGIEPSAPVLGDGIADRGERSPFDRASLSREPLAALAGSSPIALLLPALASAAVDVRTIRALVLLAALDAAPMTARRLLSSATAPGAHGSSVASAAPQPEPSLELDPDPPSPPISEPPLEPWQDVHLDARARARSDWGGLLFTLAIIRDQQLWSTLDGLAVRLDLDFRAVLHGLGRSLVTSPIDPADPALLAFIGLAPDASPPALDPERAPILAATLEPPRARLLAALDDRLPTRPERGEALLAWVLRRRVEVVGEPGWIELHLDLRDVDVDIRRAGLDLHPDWIAELGVVMRFVYG